MRQMMRGFADPFGQDPFLSITGDGERTADRRVHRDSQAALRRNHRVSVFLVSEDCCGALGFTGNRAGSHFQCC